MLGAAGAGGRRTMPSRTRMRPRRGRWPPGPSLRVRVAWTWSPVLLLSPFRWARMTDRHAPGTGCASRVEGSPPLAFERPCADGSVYPRAESCPATSWTRSSASTKKSSGVHPRGSHARCIAPFGSPKGGHECTVALGRRDTAAFLPIAGASHGSPPRARRRSAGATPPGSRSRRPRCGALVHTDGDAARVLPPHWSGTLGMGRVGLLRRIIAGDVGRAPRRSRGRATR